MSQLNDPFAALKEVWSEYEEFSKLSEAEREAWALRNLSATRATIGGPPLDHLPTHAELAEEWAIKKAKYHRKRRAWASILGDY